MPSFGPPLPPGATFLKGKDFAHFLLAKVINGELATLRSEKFVSMATRTRHEYLKDLVANHSSATPLEQPNKFCEWSIRLYLLANDGYPFAFGKYPGTISLVAPLLIYLY